jgi:hypothetical protein
MRLLPCTAVAAETREAAILTMSDSSWAEQLAAREVRRYLYLRTGLLVPIVSDQNALPAKTSRLVVARKDRPGLAGLVSPDVASALAALPPQGYWLKTTLPATADGKKPKSKLLLVVGGDDAGTLYAAYRLAEILGVRFYLHGDTIPDERMHWRLPELDEKAAPLFALRGIQPFHDFPEGPDWWNRDDYLAILGQLPKLKMNFFGLHTYPEERPNAEPTVWIGKPEDFGEGGKVKFSYPTSYMNSLRGNWGYLPRKTSEYVLGSSALFERDDFGCDVMTGFMPSPTTPDASNEVFDRAAAVLREAFEWAHRLGVKTCVGTETPLVVPKLVRERLKAEGKKPADFATARLLYEGMFRRIAQAYPIDYYWFWTPEGWTWSGVKSEEIAGTTNDLFSAIAAHQAVQPPFALATCGWVLGPQQDRAMFDKVLPKDIAVSCINRQVGYTPVDAGFAEVKGRSKWAIPWMEDDPALTSPQLWVGRMRRDAADALRYGCDGLMGIHWRTRVLGPNVGALAQAAWEQKPWADAYELKLKPAQSGPIAGPVGGEIADFPNHPIAGTADPILYRTVRYNLSAYHLPATNGSCQVTLKFSEPNYDLAGKRVFDVNLQGRPVITNLDIFARVGKDRALDLTFTNVVVTNGWIDVDFVPRVEFPSIAALDIKGDGYRIRINCGGPAYQDYQADPPGASAVQVFAPTKDFYKDWANHEFGLEVGGLAAHIFGQIDCQLPTPSVWTDGPGGIKPDPRPWSEVKPAYGFVDDFATLGPRVRGAGNRERFDYWLNTFHYFRAIGELNCLWGEYNRVMENLKGAKGLGTQGQFAREFALPARRKLVRQVRQVYDHLLATVSTTGELGTVANWNQHNLPVLLGGSGEDLAKMLGDRLPPDLQPGLDYRGPARLIVPTKRTMVGAGESLKIKAMVLAEKRPRRLELHWRPLGKGGFSKIPLQPVARGVYSVELPPAKQDFEYYIQLDPAEGQRLHFPPTAPDLNQTVIVQ